MSIGILIGVHDGLVLASDSASTLTLSTPQGQQGVLGVFNNANKIFNLCKGKPIGCVAFGAGSIGNASISRLLKDFRARLRTDSVPPFDTGDYTMEQVSHAVAEFLVAECRQTEATRQSPSLGILLAGYSTKASLGESWVIEIENGQASKIERLRQPQEAGISWGGEAEAVVRLVLGFGSELPGVLRSAVRIDQPEKIDQLVDVLRMRLQAPLVFAPLPIQDAIDLAEFLVHASIMFSRFTPGAPTVGGPIELAAITKHEGFKWIRRKHYFDSAFNKESQP